MRWEWEWEFAQKDAWAKTTQNSCLSCSQVELGTHGSLVRPSHSYQYVLHLANPPPPK